MKKNRKYLILIFLAIFILRIPSLYQPVLDMDESVFGEFACSIMNGGIPYVDAVDNKPPLTYYFFSLVYLIFGTNNLIAIHLVTIFIVMATAYLIFRMCSEFVDERAGIISAMIFTALAHIYEPKYISTNGETLINLPLVLSAYLYLKYSDAGKRNIFALMAGGFSLGTAIMINYKAGIFAVVLIIYSLIIKPFFTDQNKPAFLFRESINLCFAGFAALIPCGLIVLYYYNLGNLNEFLFWGFTYNFGYIETGSGAVPVLKTAARAGYFILCSIPVWILICFYIMKSIRIFLFEKLKNNENNSARLFIFLLTWFGFSFYAVLLGGRAYGHYFIQLIVPLSLLGGYVYNRSIPDNKKASMAFWIFFCVINILFFVSRININATYELVNYPNRQADTDYKIIGEYIRKNSLPEDRIYAWGWATPVYHYADRRCASRFLISDFISGRVFGTDNDSKTIQSSIDKERGKLFISDLEKNLPEYFIDTSPAGHYGYDRFPVAGYRDLYNFISTNYKLVKSINKIDIYKRN